MLHSYIVHVQVLYLNLLALLQSFMAALGMLFLGSIFVYRYAFHSPDFEGNFAMIFHLIAAFMVIGFGLSFAYCEDDPETDGEQYQQY